MPAGSIEINSTSVTLGHARVIVEHGLQLPDAAARAPYETAVLDHAGHRHARPTAPHRPARLFLTGQPSGCPDAPHAVDVGIRAVRFS